MGAQRLRPSSTGEWTDGIFVRSITILTTARNSCGKDVLLILTMPCILTVSATPQTSALQNCERLTHLSNLDLIKTQTLNPKRGGGFAFGCVVMVLLEQLPSSARRKVI